MDQENYDEVEEIGKIIVDGARSCANIDEDRYVDLTSADFFSLPVHSQGRKDPNRRCPACNRQPSFVHIIAAQNIRFP
jgi:hypothetical protein